MRGAIPDCLRRAGSGAAQWRGAHGPTRRRRRPTRGRSSAARRRSPASRPRPSRQRPSWRGPGKAARPSTHRAAIVDGVVYVGTATGELIALGLADGTLRWRYKAGEAIGESSPAVAGGRVFIGDLDGVVHAVNVADGKAAWTFKTKSEIKSSPVVVGDLVLMGSYDGNRSTGWAPPTASCGGRYATENYVHGTPSIVERRRALCRLRRGVPRRRRQRRQGTHADLGHRLHRRVGRARRRRGVLRHVRQPGAGARPGVPQGALALRAPRPQVPVLLVGGGGRRARWCSAGATAWCTRSTPGTGKARWTYMTRARIDSSPAIAGGRAYRRVERRPALRAGSRERESGVGARRRRRAQRVARPRLGAHRHRIDGRPLCLPG